MLGVVLGAVISTLTLEGEVTREGGDYLVVPFEDQARSGAVRIRQDRRARRDSSLPAIDCRHHDSTLFRSRPARDARRRGKARI